MKINHFFPRFIIDKSVKRVIKLKKSEKKYPGRIIKCFTIKSIMILLSFFYLNEISLAQSSSSYLTLKSQKTDLVLESKISITNNSYFVLFNSRLLETNSIISGSTPKNLTNYFRKQIVYYSIKDELDNDVVSTDHSLNPYKIEKKTNSRDFVKSYQVDFKFSNYLLQSDAFFNAFLYNVERKTFFNDLTTKHNQIYTNEFPILEFQSVAAQQYWSGTKFWGGIGVAMIGVLMVTPKSITKWEEDYIENAQANLRRAFTEPPVWDEDHWEINYIGHPYAGALYYNTIRAQGGSMINSFVFSAIISTGWEYLYEGVAERPSIQDLWVTPVVGSILGEIIHQATLGMRKNGYSIFEAAFVTVFNPMYVILNGYN